MPAIPGQLMDSSTWQVGPLELTKVYGLLSPRVNVTGRMALVLLLAVVWAFGWLLLRAYTVIQTPNDVLVDKLGLDIPAAPQVTLEEISKKEVEISWKNGDVATSVHEYHIEVNGRIIGGTRKSETVVAIQGLQPGTSYDIRVFSVSTTRFQTPSAYLHIRTPPVSDGDSQVERSDAQPTVRVLAQRSPPTPSLSAAPGMSREASGGPVGRRGTLGRRPSPAGNEGTDIETIEKATEEDSGDKLEELSQQMEKLKEDCKAIDAQIVEEDREFDASVKDKEAERDDIRQKLKERDEISGSLRRDVHKAETANRTAQTEKTKKEKLLEQKQSSRRKRKDEMAKWENDTAIMIEEMATLKTQKTLVERKKLSDISQIRQKIDEEQHELAVLEDENKEKALEIKALEEEQEQLNAEEDTEERYEEQRQEQEKYQGWRDRMNELHASCNKVMYDLQQAHQHLAYIRGNLENVRKRVIPMPQQAPVSLDLNAFRRGKPIRRDRHASSHGSNVSSPQAAFRNTEPFNSMGAPFQNAVSASPTTAAPPFFNPQNGMTMLAATDEFDHIEEPELLMSAPMSPRADALIPADLLGDESEDEFADDEEPPRQSSLGAVTQVRGDEDHSPESGTSSSPAPFPSPHQDVPEDVPSTKKVQYADSDEVEDDEQSGTMPAKKPSAMSNLFGFNRQRGKTHSDQPPLLGSLKPGQSQSFPRNLDDFDPSAQPKRRLSYGGNWAFGSTLLNRGSSAREADNMVSGRRPFQSLFNKSTTATQDYDPFAPSQSLRGEASPSRPASVYSFDKLPRISAERQFHAWSLDKNGMRNSPLGPDWSSVSRSQSRRPSIGYGGSTSNLSLGPPADEDDEYIPPRREPSRPLQAPIGTRPASSQRPSTPKLNPAAPSFSSMFSFKSREKTRDRAKIKDKDTDSTPKQAPVDNVSPPESRRSKDTHSIAATASTYESRDSLERTTSGYSGSAQTDSYSLSTPSKPSVMTRMVRKASSNKFGSFKAFSSRKAGEASTPTGETDDDNNQTGSLEQLGRSYESMGSTPTTGTEDKKSSRTSLSSTWNFMRKAKKDKTKDENAPSEVSESLTSERASIDDATAEDSAEE